DWRSLRDNPSESPHRPTWRVVAWRRGSYGSWPPGPWTSGVHRRRRLIRTLRWNNATVRGSPGTAAKPALYAAVVVAVAAVAFGACRGGGAKEAGSRAATIEGRGTTIEP